MTSPVLISHSNGVLHIEFNRPEKKNAINLEMYTQAATAIEEADTNPEIKVILFSGRGDSFTAGNDVGDFLSATAKQLEGSVQFFLRTVPICSKPIIAAIQGHAVGIGTTLLLHCDLVYADSTAKLQMPFVNLGLCPEFGSTLLLPQLIGQRRATELLLFGKSINAQTALDYGLINAIDDNCLEFALKQAHKLAAQAPTAVQITKQLLHQTDKETLLKVIKSEGVLFRER